jgi:hypothetical protein
MRRRTLDLTACERKESSQNGEDGVVEEILSLIGAPRRYFVEFGVGPGAEGNCVRLADVAGWDGLFMEADHDDHARLAAKYAWVARVRTRRERVSAENIVRALRDESVPSDLDVLSIDIDGNDYWVWEALDGFAPRLVIIEYNGTLGSRDALVQPLSDEPWNGTSYFGASITALRRLGARKGYRLVHTDSRGVNAFFVRQDLAGPFLAEDQVPAHELAVALPPDPRRRTYVDLDTASAVASGELTAGPSEP